MGCCKSKQDKATFAPLPAQTQGAHVAVEEAPPPKKEEPKKEEPKKDESSGGLFQAGLGALQSGVSNIMGTGTTEKSKEAEGNLLETNATKDEEEPYISPETKKMREEVGDAATNLFRNPDKDRAKKFLETLKNQPPNGMIMEGIRCFLKYGITPLLYVGSLYVWLFTKAYNVYLLLPTNLAQMVFGAALCMFGGTYFAGIAAVEAARMFGGPEMLDHLKTCWEEGSRIKDAQLKDEEEHQRELKTNKPQKEESPGELMRHKTLVAMKAIEDPGRLQKATLALGNIWVAVIATLKFQFAKTVAVALGIASQLTLPTTRIAGPPLASLIGHDLAHWVPAIIDTTLKGLAVVIASYIQAFISAFYSGIRGGRLFAEGLLHIAGDKGLLDKLPDSVVEKPFDPDKSMLDEIIAFPLAAFGFYWQVSHGFDIIFPFNIILLPLSLVEWFIRIQVFT